MFQNLLNKSKNILKELTTNCMMFLIPTIVYLVLSFITSTFINIPFLGYFAQVLNLIIRLIFVFVLAMIFRAKYSKVKASSKKIWGTVAAVLFITPMFSAFSSVLSFAIAVLNDGRMFILSLIIALITLVYTLVYLYLMAIILSFLLTDLSVEDLGKYAKFVLSKISKNIIPLIVIIASYILASLIFMGLNNLLMRIHIGFLIPFIYCILFIVILLFMFFVLHDICNEFMSKKDELTYDKLDEELQKGFEESTEEFKELKDIVVDKAKDLKEKMNTSANTEENEEVVEEVIEEKPTTEEVAEEKEEDNKEEKND